MFLISRRGASALVVPFAGCRMFQLALRLHIVAVLAALCAVGSLLVGAASDDGLPSLSLSSSSSLSASSTYHRSPISPASFDCQWFTKPRGVISTPNFPRPYPVPLRLCYVIKREPDTRELRQKTVIYFTQYYLLTGVSIDTYDNFVGFDDDALGSSGRAVIFQPVATERPTELEIQSQFVVITVDVDKVTGVNMRVLYDLLDVYGFNITYEFIPDAQPTRLNGSQQGDSDLENGCILDHCKFNGWCVAEANFSKYVCECFPGFWGLNCQYSEKCNTDKNPCNEGTCEHHIGGSTSVCFCKHGYTGPHCDVRIVEDQCSARGCTKKQMGSCTYTKQRNSRCECSAGNRLKGCDCEPGWRRAIDALADPAAAGVCERVDVAWLHWRITGDNLNADELTGNILEQVQVRNVTVLAASKGLLRFQLVVDRGGVDAVMQSLLQIGRRFESSDVFQEDDLTISALVSNKPLPVREGIEPVVLSCVFRAPEGFQVQWYKDGAPIKPSVGPGNLWLEHGQRTRDGVLTSYLGLDRVQYIDKGRFTCELRHGDEVRTRSLQMLISMVPGGHITPLAQSVQVGRRHELTCTLRVLDKVQYRWFKNTIRDESVVRGGPKSITAGPETQLRKKWVRIASKGQLSDPEFVENFFPAHSRLVIPAVSSYAEYQCQIEDLSVTTAVYAHVFPYDSSSQFCPSEEWMGIHWNRTVLGGHDVQPCHLPWGLAKGDARRRCLAREGSDTPRWEVPDFSECAYDEIYNIRKQVLSLARGYQLTTGVRALRALRRYIEARHGSLLPGEGNHIMETLHEILDYEQSLPPDHPERFERKEALQLFVDCVAMTFDVANSVLDERFYAKLNEMIPQFVVNSLGGEPPDTDFRYSHRLFDIYARVFKVRVPPEGYVSIYEAALDDEQVSGYLVRSRRKSDEGQVILSLWVFKSLTQDYLSRLEWLQSQGDRRLRSKMVNFRAATRYTNGSLHYHNRGELYVNFRMIPTMNSTMSCAMIVDGSEVSFDGAELGFVGPDEFSCSLAVTPRPALVALYEGPAPPVMRLPSRGGRILRIVCSSGGLLLAFLSALSITCTTSCWSLVKCVKWNVCLALLAMFSAALIEVSVLADQWPHKSTLTFIRQFLLLVVFCQQLVLLVSIYAELFEKKLLRGSRGLGSDITYPVAAPWVGTAILLGLAYGAQKLWDTDRDSYWGTLEDEVSLPSAAFTLLVIVVSMVYALLLFEIGTTWEDRSKETAVPGLSTLQRGLLQRSLLIATAVVAHGFTTSGYLSDPTGNLQAVTSIILALVVFLVYTAYCETDIFYHAVWAHYKKKQKVKSMASH